MCAMLLLFSTASYAHLTFFSGYSHILAQEQQRHDITHRGKIPSPSAAPGVRGTPGAAILKCGPPGGTIPHGGCRVPAGRISRCMVKKSWRDEGGVGVWRK